MLDGRKAAHVGADFTENRLHAGRGEPHNRYQIDTNNPSNCARVSGDGAFFVLESALAAGRSLCANIM